MILGFVLLAATLAAAAVLVVAIPLLRGTAAPAAPWSALVAGSVLLLGGLLLYITWSNYAWRTSASPDSPQTMVARLARQLESEPNNLDGWLMLGRSYIVLQEFPLALRAYERADRLSDGKNPEALLGEAEVLVLQDPAELTGRGGRLIERALELAPDSGRALFFGATAAARRGQLPLARERFARLLAMNPPENVRPLIEGQIRMLDEEIQGGGTARTAPAAATPDNNGPAAAASVRVNITLSPKLTAGDGQAPLFVFVRRAGEGGPPLAAKRLSSQFPQAVTLTPADAMIPGRSFAAGQAVQVVARIGRSGSPMGASGDPFGELTYRVGQDGLANLVIDRLTP